MDRTYGIQGVQWHFPAGGDGSHASKLISQRLFFLRRQTAFHDLVEAVIAPLHDIRQSGADVRHIARVQMQPVDVAIRVLTDTVDTVRGLSIVDGAPR